MRLYRFWTTALIWSMKCQVQVLGDNWEEARTVNLSEADWSHFGRERDSQADQLQMLFMNSLFVDGDGGRMRSSFGQSMGEGRPCQGRCFVVKFLDFDLRDSERQYRLFLFTIASSKGYRSQRMICRRQ